MRTEKVTTVRHIVTIAMSGRIRFGGLAKLGVMPIGGIAAGFSKISCIIAWNCVEDGEGDGIAIFIEKSCKQTKMKREK